MRILKMIKTGTRSDAGKERAKRFHSIALVVAIVIVTTKIPVLIVDPALLIATRYGSTLVPSVARQCKHLARSLENLPYVKKYSE